MMQEIKTFMYGGNPMNNTPFNHMPIDEQINAYLKDRPNHSVKTMSTIVGPGYTQAFVVFDVREQKEQRDSRPQKKEK